MILLERLVSYSQLGRAGCAAGRSVAFGARGSGVRRSGTSQVETVGLSWTTPLERSKVTYRTTALPSSLLYLLSSRRNARTLLIGLNRRPWPSRVMPSGPQLPASQFGDSWYPNSERLDVAILLLVGSHGAAFSDDSTCCCSLVEYLAV